MSGSKSVLAAIDYIHMNPVRRGLVGREADWRPSSARHYVDSCAGPDPELPPVEGLPAKYLREIAG